MAGPPIEDEMVGLGPDPHRGPARHGRSKVVGSCGDPRHVLRLGDGSSCRQRGRSSAFRSTYTLPRASPPSDASAALKPGVPARASARAAADRGLDRVERAGQDDRAIDRPGSLGRRRCAGEFRDRDTADRFVAWRRKARSSLSQAVAAAVSRTEATSRTAGDDGSVPSIETPSWPLNQGLISVEKSCLLSVIFLTSRSSPSSALASKLVWSAKPGKLRQEREQVGALVAGHVGPDLGVDHGVGGRPGQDRRRRRGRGDDGEADRAEAENGGCADRGEGPAQAMCPAGRRDRRVGSPGRRPRRRPSAPSRWLARGRSRSGRPVRSS